MQIVQGSIFDATTEAIVNPVNTVGVSGKGLALEFKKRYPGAQRVYEDACDKGHLSIGRVLAVPVATINPKFVVYVPTKQHWQLPSQMTWVREGVKALIGELQSREIKSVAVPALGCGLGQLNWVEVAPLIWHLFQNYAPEIQLVLYGPLVLASGRSAEPQPVRPGAEQSPISSGDKAESTPVSQYHSFRGKRK